MVRNSLQKAVFADFLLARNRFRTNYKATFLWDSNAVRHIVQERRQTRCPWDIPCLICPQVPAINCRKRTRAMNNAHEALKRFPLSPHPKGAKHTRESSDDPSANTPFSLTIAYLRDLCDIIPMPSPSKCHGFASPCASSGAYLSVSMFSTLVQATSR